MPKISTEKLIDELFEFDNENKNDLKCPKCKSTEAFSAITIAIAAVIVDKNRNLVEVKDLIVDFDESLWQCEECSCIFDNHGDMLA